MRFFYCGILTACFLLGTAGVSLADVDITTLKRRVMSTIQMIDQSDASYSEELHEELSGPIDLEFQHDALGSSNSASHHTTATCDGRHLMIQGDLANSALRSEDDLVDCLIRNDVTLWFTTPPGQVYPPAGPSFRVSISNPYGAILSVAIFDNVQSRYLLFAGSIDEDLDITGQLQGSGDYYFGVLTEANSEPGTPLFVTSGLEFLFEVLDESAVATENRSWGGVKALFR